MPRPAKTIRQHLLEGTVPQGKANLDSKFSGGRPRIPKHLSPEARTEYKRAVQFLEKRGTLTPGDYGQLSLYASVFARWLQAKEAVGKDLMVDVTVTDNNGTAHTVRRLNPLLKVCESCESRLLALTRSLGLTPQARDTVKPTKKEAEPEQDPMEQFLNRAPRGPLLVPVNPTDMKASDDDEQPQEEISEPDQSN